MGLLLLYQRFRAVYYADGTPAIVGTDVEHVTVGTNFDDGNVMRYVAPPDDHYIYNWSLKTVTNGTKTLRIFLGEGIN